MKLKENHSFDRVSSVEIDPEYAEQRVDNYLISVLKGVPRSRIYRIIRKGEVRVNKKRVQAHYKLNAGDVLRIPPIRLAPSNPDAVVVSEGLGQRLQQAVLYEDDAVVVLNKPSGLAVHGGSGIDLGLIEALRKLRSEPGLELVHRLDRETSGCILLARKRSALRQLHADLREGRVEKKYTALAQGTWPRRFSEIRAPLLKNHLKSGERMVVVSEQGKLSHTRFRVLQALPTATLLEAEPVTGRTHQIRVHARFAGCPLAGDSKYGEDAANKQFRSQGLRRLFLHASRLGFTSPVTGERLSVEAPLPRDLETILDSLSN